MALRKLGADPRSAETQAPVGFEVARPLPVQDATNNN